ncbi:MAG: hypothetical protein ACK4IX_10770, partial [Candidatus Sericytochromatia bacterium]
ISSTNIKKEVETEEIRLNNTIEKSSKTSEIKDPPNDDKKSKFKKSDIKRGSAIYQINLELPKDEQSKLLLSKTEEFLDKNLKEPTVTEIRKKYKNTEEPNSNATLQEKQEYKKIITTYHHFDLIKNTDKVSLKKDGNGAIINFRFKNNMDKNVNSIPKLNANDYGKNKEFFYVNGMVTDEKTAKSTGKELEKLLGNKINVIHNPTKGGLNDFIESLSERHNVFIPGITKGMIKGTTFDEITVKTANKFLDKINNEKELKIVCHSQGGAITSNALEYAKQKLLSDGKSEKEISKIMSKIEVVTLGAATSPDKFPEGVKVVQIYHPKDPVPKVAGKDLSSEDSEIMSLRKKSNIQTKVAKNNTESTGIVEFVDRFEEALKGIKKTLIDDNFAEKKRISFEHHSVDDGYQSYLDQPTTRSLIYNFGRQDFE